MNTDTDISKILESVYLDPDQVAKEAAAGNLFGKWQIFNMEDAYQDREPLKFLVDGLLPYPSLSIVYGGPGSLKSMLLADLAVCVAGGVPWLEPLPTDREQPGRTFRVEKAGILWIDFDNGKRRTHTRIGAFGRARGLPSNIPVHYVSMPTPPLDASNRAFVEELAKLIKHLSVKMVIIDNLGLITGDTEENSAGMAQVMGNLRWLCEETDTAVIVIHHQRKASAADNGARKGETLRGHSSIEASLDLALIVERKNSDDTVTIIPTKVRDYKVVDLFGAKFTYQHKEGTRELETARFFSINTETEAEREIRLIVDSAQRQIEEAGKPLKQGDLVDLIRDHLATQGRAPAINRVRGVLTAAVADGRLKGFMAEKGKENRAQFYDLPTSTRAYYSDDN